MTSPGSLLLGTLIERREDDLLALWAQHAGAGSGAVRQRQADSKEFVGLLRQALTAAGATGAPDLGETRRFLGTLSASRTRQGASPAETATFIFSLKQPLFTLLREELMSRPEQLVDEIWAASLLVDQLGLYVTEVAQKARDEVISRQQQELLELSTPVVTLWDDIIALPLIGTLDSARTQVVMESLLQKIVDTGSSIAIIDITGVPTVDTLVAQHLLKTVAAARLMGADCIISGIRPQIAQTIVHLGVDLSEVTTKATLASALQAALQLTGSRVEPLRPKG